MTVMSLIWGVLGTLMHIDAQRFPVLWLGTFTSQMKNMLLHEEITYYNMQQ